MSHYGAEEKALHVMIGASVLFEQVMEHWMQRPKPGETAATLHALLFGAHEFIGVSLLVIVIARFLLMAGRKNSFLRLFPWLRASGRQGLARQLKALPIDYCAGEQELLTGSVQGLGLLLALGLGLTGLILFIELSPEGLTNATGHGAMALHEAMGMLLWAFLFVHIAMAIHHPRKAGVHLKQTMR